MSNSRSTQTQGWISLAITTSPSSSSAGQIASSLHHPASVDHKVEDPAALLRVQVADLFGLFLLQAPVPLDGLLNELFLDHEVWLRLQHQGLAQLDFLGRKKVKIGSVVLAQW